MGIITLLFGASGVFAELKDALNTVWDVRVKADRGWVELIKDRFMSFAMMFRYLPDIHIAWRDVLIRAVLTAALFTVGKYLIGLYLGKAGIETPYGAAGSIVAFVAWIYYSGLIFLYGAELTRVLTRRLGHYVEPLDHAEWIPRGAVRVGYSSRW